MKEEWSSDLSNVKICDWICTYLSGWVRVASLLPGEGHPVMTEDYEVYTIDGKRASTDSIPVAFSEPPEWIVDMVGPKPCCFKKGDKVLVGDSKITWVRRYFSHIDADGRFCCFIEGKDEWSSDGKTKPSKFCKWEETDK